jgi:hypothetical protein
MFITSTCGLHATARNLAPIAVVWLGSAPIVDVINEIINLCVRISPFALDFPRICPDSTLIPIATNYVGHIVAFLFGIIILDFHLHPKAIRS